VAKSRREIGLEKIDEVYAGDVVVPPEGTVPFTDLMLEQVFAEVWTRGELSMRDRRLLILGAIAAQGAKDAWLVQVRAALKKGELTQAQLHEVFVQLAQYVGYPRLAGLITDSLRVMGEVAAEQAKE